MTADQAEQAIPDEEMTRDLYVRESDGEVEEVVSEEVVVEEGDTEKSDDEVTIEASDEEATIETTDEVTSDAADEKGDVEKTTDGESTEDQSETKDDVWSLASVGIDDVSVVYNYSLASAEASEPETDDQSGEEGTITEDEDYVEPEVEVGTFSAEVTDVFNNDDGSLDVTFKGLKGEEFNTFSYTVRFAGTDAYAVVQVVPVPENTDVVIEDVDFDAQIQELSDYQPDFEEADISLPEGTYIEDGTLIVTDEAETNVADTLIDSGFAEEEMDRLGPDDEDSIIFSDDGSENGNANNNNNDGFEILNDDRSEAEKYSDRTIRSIITYQSEFNATKKRLDNLDSVAKHTPEILGYVHPTAGEVGSYGADAYYIIKGFHSNNFGNVFEGSLGIHKLCGIVKTPKSSEGAILSALQEVGVEVAEIHCITKMMYGQLNETLRQAYANNLQIFDNAMVSLHSNAEAVQNAPFCGGSAHAYLDGIEPVDEDCTLEEEVRIHHKLIRYIKEHESTGEREDSAFQDFTSRVEAMTQDYTLIAGEVAKLRQFNPITAYDKYWNLYFNFDTQGYYLRQSYRSDIEYELKRAFNLMEIYYNMFDPNDAGTHLTYYSSFRDAMDRLGQLDAGVEPKPENIRVVHDRSQGCSREFKTKVTCNSLGKTIKGLEVTWFPEGNKVNNDLIEEYVSRLHGRSIQDDLRLAGLWNDVDSGKTTWGAPAYEWSRCAYSMGAHGIAFNGRKDGKNTWKADILRYDNKTMTNGQKTYDKGNLFQTFDGCV